MSWPTAKTAPDRFGGARGATTLRRWRPARILLLAAALAWLLTALWHSHKPLPPGVHVAGEFFATPADSLQLLTDLAWSGADGQATHARQIHAATLDLVRSAQDFLVLDYFLFNNQGGPAGPLKYQNGLEPVSSQLTQALRELRAAQPDLPVLLLVDPINDYYRGTPPPALQTLQQMGIDVVVTRLEPLRDSNPAYSAAWRLLFSWSLPTRGDGALPNLLDAQGPGLRVGALLRLPNFKANHRKVIITGDGKGSLIGIVASANPHDASSAHSNIALQVQGEALRPLLASELAVARFSGWQGNAPRSEATAASPSVSIDNSSGTRVAIATEGAIHDALVARLDAAGAGDAIDIAQFYFSERHVIRALRAAAKRGAAVRVLLDPNKDAFGFEKSGIPNRQVAGELLGAEGNFQLRWVRTHGEQFHAKLAAVRSGHALWFTLGSANFTRRNLDDLNLEANVIVETSTESSIATAVTSWFEQLWSNRDGIEYSVDAAEFHDDSRLRYWRYRLMEATGLSTF